MNRRSFFLGLSGLAGCTRSEQPRLNVFNWSAYVAPDTISNFEREFGARVRYSVYESNEEMLARVLTGNSGWDVVFPSNYFISPMVANDLLAPVQHEAVGNLSHLDPRFQHPEWDPELRWSVPYMYGACGILYRATGAPPSAWADLWSNRWGGRMTMLDDPGEVLGACLKKIGNSINSTDPAVLERAKQEAMQQKRLLRAYLNAEVRDQVVAGDVLAAQSWATTSQQAIDAAPALRFCYPQEGFSLYADSAVILRESRRQDLAHSFVNYLLRPKVAAEIVAAVKTATVNAGARALLAPELRDSPILYPAESVLARGEWFRTLPPAAQRLRDRIWTEIKSA